MVLVAIGQYQSARDTAISLQEYAVLRNPHNMYRTVPYPWGGHTVQTATIGCLAWGHGETGMDGVDGVGRGPRQQLRVPLF
jgi:hypothetical protein